MPALTGSSQGADELEDLPARSQHAGDTFGLCEMLPGHLYPLHANPPTFAEPSLAALPYRMSPEVPPLLAPRGPGCATEAEPAARKQTT